MEKNREKSGSRGKDSHPLYEVSDGVFSDIPWLLQAFSFRRGGVSPEPYGMNLSFTVGDDPENVTENYRRMAEALGISVDQMVYAHQTHTVNVMSVGAEHGGMGIVRERNFHDVDAIVTHEPGICLVTGHADCVPIYLADQKHRVIALAHAGWRATLGNIAANTIRVMCEEHGASPEDILADIGPCVCRDCYEVGEELAEYARDAYEADDLEDILAPSESKPGKYQLDLRRANVVNLIRAGVSPERISVSGHCTCCDADLFHSHRAATALSVGQASASSVTRSDGSPTTAATAIRRGGNSAFFMIIPE